MRNINNFPLYFYDFADVDIGRCFGELAMEKGRRSWPGKIFHLPRSLVFGGYKQQSNGEKERVSRDLPYLPFFGRLEFAINLIEKPVRIVLEIRTIPKPHKKQYPSAPTPTPTAQGASLSAIPSSYQCLGAQMRKQCILVQQQHKYIEQSREKMSFSSISDMNSVQSSLENDKRCQKEDRKRKKIRKDRRKRSRMHVVEREHEIKNVYEFLSRDGQDYLERTLNQLLAQYRNQYRSELHIKSILGQDENVYNVKNYELCEKQAKEYLDLINLLEGVRFQKIGVRNRESRIIVQLCHAKKREDGPKKQQVHLLNKTESFLYRKRRQIFKEIDEFLGRLTHQLKENQNLDHIDKEILTLCKLNTLQQASIIDFFNKMSASQANDNLHNVHLQPIQPQNSLNDEYISLLIKKNLRMAFDETPIDVLNYFKIVENGQRNIHDDVPLKRLSNTGELKEYLKNKKHKFGKNQQHSLKTCCSGCFSNYYEIYNPIETCGQCGMRMHRFCQKMRGKCQRCKYIRKTVEEKSQSHFCTICNRGNQKGLLIQSCNKGGKEEYVHTFCLLVHQQWKVEGETLIQNFSEDLSTTSSCKFCEKEAHHTLQCSGCDQRVHGMCAYLQGCSLSLAESGQVLVSCCGAKADQERLSFQRKFKLNYQKLLYKKSSQFYSLLQSS